VSDRRTLLAGIVLLAIVVRLAGLGDRLSEDEAFSWLVGSAPDWDTFLDRLAAFENTPPLFYALLTPLPLDDEHWLRLPSLVASIVSVPVLYLAVRPLLGTPAALLSALGLAVSPYAVNWSNFSRGFMLANLGLLIALWAVARLATGGDRRWWWVYAGGAVLAMYSEYDAVLFLAALIATFAWTSPGRRREILALGALPVLALLPWLGEFLRSLDHLDETKAAPMYPHPSLASLRDSTVPLFAGEHGTSDSAGMRTLEFALIVAALGVAVELLRARGMHRALKLLGLTALGTLALHALATLLGPDIFQQRYLTSLIPLLVGLLAGAVVLVPWRWATAAVALLLVGVGAAVFVQRHDRELEPDMEPIKALIEQSGERTVLANSARVSYYLDDLHPRLDRPLGFGIDAEQACEPDCPPLAIVDDARAPAGVRTGPGRTEVFGPIHVRLRPDRSGESPSGVQLQRGSADLQPRNAGGGVTRGWQRGAGTAGDRPGRRGHAAQLTG
jgi:4-amino-4-deoxy-L-arabinose transferase-like glycosyltransferase